MSEISLTLDIVPTKDRSPFDFFAIEQNKNCQLLGISNYAQMFNLKLQNQGVEVTVQMHLNQILDVGCGFDIALLPFMRNKM